MGLLLAFGGSFLFQICVSLYNIVVLNTQRFGSLGVDFELLKVKLVVIASEVYSIYWSLRLVVFFEKKF